MRSARGTSLLVLSLAISVVFAWLAVRNVDWGLFWEGLREMQYLWLVPSLAALALAVVVRAFRWQFLFYAETRPAFGPVTRALLVGLFVNCVLPARAGEAARIVVLHQEAGTSRVEALGTAVVERLYDIVALVLLLFVATPFLPEVTWLRRAAIVAAILATLIVVAVIVLDRFGSRPIRFVLRPFARFPGLSADHVERASENLLLGLGALHRAHLAVPAFLLTVLSWLVLAAGFWFVLIGFGLGLGFEAGLLVLVTTTLALVIPSAPGGLGVFEAGGLVALRAFDVEDSTALSCTVVLHALSVLPYMLAGAVVLHRHVRLLPALRQEAKARLDA
jgi:glycosyltransferase 2 family protein